MSEDELKTLVGNLKREIKRKDRETDELLDRIDELEETVMRLEALIPEESNNKKSKKKQATDSKLAIELDERVKQVRDLKDKMGLLRKEKMQVQRELEQLKSRDNESSVIRVEDLRTKSPLNALVKDLQETVNKQRSLISKLRFDVSESDKFKDQLKAKNEEIEFLKSDISELNQKFKDLGSTSENKSEDSIAKKLIEDLQNQLNKSKRQIIELNQKITKNSKKSKKESREKSSSEIKIYKEKINELRNLLEEKNNALESLKNEIGDLKKSEIAASFGANETPSEDMIKTLKEDLQTQLNKSKLQIKSLQEKLKKYEKSKSKESSKSRKEIEGSAKMQREMAIFLQKQLDTKEGEIETIKNEAVQIKKRYRQLENQLKLKDQKLNEIQTQLDSHNLQPEPQSRKEDSHVALRVKELMQINDNLKKENIEQRIEITQLRNKA
jgi:chromosome segregation ATPase